MPGLFGGDDVLALLPVDSCLPVARALHDTFEDEIRVAVFTEMLHLLSRSGLPSVIVLNRLRISGFMERLRR